MPSCNGSRHSVAASDGPQPLGQRGPRAFVGRYDRQTRLAEIGEEGQRRLGSASVLIVGVGGLGSPAAMYLAGAGVGTIALCDFDVVDRTNLHRQPIYTDADVGHKKIDVAAARLRAINPDIKVVLQEAQVNPANAGNLV